MIDFHWEIRFVDTAKNYLFVMVLSILLPISILTWSLNRASKLKKVNGIIISLILVIPCYFVATVASSNFEDIKNNGVDYSFEKINKLQINDNNYVLYRTNGGATTSFGLVLRFEKPFIKGLKFVKVIYSKDKASESTLEFEADNRITMHIQPYNKGDDVEVVSFDL